MTFLLTASVSSALSGDVIRQTVHRPSACSSNVEVRYLLPKEAVKRKLAVRGFDITAGAALNTDV